MRRMELLMLSRLITSPDLAPTLYIQAISTIGYPSGLTSRAGRFADMLHVNDCSGYSRVTLPVVARLIMHGR